jgi:hypothetical protein
MYLDTPYITQQMDINTAVIIIQRWFRSKLSLSRCVISHQAFVADYVIVLDKQVYNANELYTNLKYSTQVPHTRRELTPEEIDNIITKRNPFIVNTQHYDTYSENSTIKPITLVLNKSSILNVTSQERRI